MLAALKKGDRARLVRLCVEHTRASKRVYMSMQGWPDLPDAPKRKRRP
jgi:hypothetical protein